MISHAILTYNKGRDSGPCRRHRHHAVAQSARGRRLQIQSAAMAARPIPTSPAWIENARQRASRGRAAGVRRMPYDRARKAPCDASPRLHQALCRRPRQRRRHGRDPRIRREDRDRSAGRRRACITGSRSSSATASTPTVVNDAVDPTFRFMTAGLGRQDPDGLLLALCDGAADRDARQVRRRLRQRHRRRPPRHRDAHRAG